MLLFKFEVIRVYKPGVCYEVATTQVEVAKLVAECRHLDNWKTWSKVQLGGSVGQTWWRPWSEIWEHFAIERYLGKN